MAKNLKATELKIHNTTLATGVVSAAGSFVSPHRAHVDYDARAGDT